MITYFTDGSALPNPGLGGFAVIRNDQPYIIGGEMTSSSVDQSQTTNIRMEATALLAAMRDADGEQCQIYTDSQFWVNVLTKWAITWQKNSWTKKNGSIKNLDLVQALYELYNPKTIELIWVRGHVGTKQNELADTWAGKARKLGLTDPVLVSSLTN